MLNTLRGLLSSRKAVIGFLTSLVTSAAAIALIFGVHLDTDQVVTILTPWVLLASVLIHGIATEDAAAKSSVGRMTVGETVDATVADMRAKGIAPAWDAARAAAATPPAGTPGSESTLYIGASQGLVETSLPTQATRCCEAVEGIRCRLPTGHSGDCRTMPRPSLTSTL